MNFVGHQGGRQLIRDEHGTSKESGGATETGNHVIL